MTTGHPAYKPVALVVGGSRGLGLLIARELAAHDCRPVICARDAQELDRAVELLRGWGRPAAGRYVCDVRDHHAVESLVAQVEREIGPVEIVVTVAGVIQVGPLASMTREHFKEAIDVMAWGPVNVALAVLPGMRRRRRGHIATVTSIGGMVSVPHLLPYSTAKFAAVGFSQGLRAELAGTGISVTTVVPGLMRTGSHLRAEFTGRQSAEYAWFAPGASLPVVSMDAEKAAARIVRGVLAGKGIVLLTPLAKVAARVSGVAPGATPALLKVFARLLPGAPAPSVNGVAATGGSSATVAPAATAATAARGESDGRPATVQGHRARSQLSSSIVERLTILGTRAASRFNEMSST